MAIVIAASLPVVQKLPAPIALLLGMAALATVVIDEFWSLLNHFARMAHEGAHAMVGSVLDTRVKGVHLNRKERKGHTDLLVVPGTGFITAVAGYWGPSGFGLAAAALIAHDQIVLVLWVGIALLAIMLPSMRGAFGITLVIGIGFLLVSVVRSKQPGVEAVTAYGLSWLLLLSGVRGIRDRRAGSGDAARLREITGLHPRLWYYLWLAGTVVALAYGTTLLV